MYFPILIGHLGISISNTDLINWWVLRYLYVNRWTPAWTISAYYTFPLFLMSFGRINNWIILILMTIIFFFDQVIQIRMHIGLNILLSMCSIWHWMIELILDALRPNTQTLFLFIKFFYFSCFSGQLIYVSGRIIQVLIEYLYVVLIIVINRIIIIAISIV